MARRSRASTFSFWQSFADLAMGLMAVFALVLVMLLWTQNQNHQALSEAHDQLQERAAQVAAERDLIEEEKRVIEEEKRTIERQRGRFAVELLQILDGAHATVLAQDSAESFIRGLFAEEGCPLEMTDDGALRAMSAAGVADLYSPGDTQLNAQGIEALTRCQRSFMRLSYCLSPEAQGASDGQGADGERAAALCAGGAAALAAMTPEERQRLAALRDGLDALVLQGNTDRAPLSPTGIPPVRDRDGSRLALGPHTHNFVQNAHLGAERARQALGHLLNLMRDHADGERDALEVLMARVRVESASFGRYQAGPREWRQPGCATAGDDCEAARNLSLKLRWKKQELRAPYEAIRGRFCALLADPESALSQGLSDMVSDEDTRRVLASSHPDVAAWLDAGRLEPASLRAHLRCEAPAP